MQIVFDIAAFVWLMILSFALRGQRQYVEELIVVINEEMEEIKSRLGMSESEVDI